MPDLDTGGPHGERPATLVLVIGTATEIGKTWVGGRTLAALRRAGYKVAARKPAQSYDPDVPEPTDAEVLGGGSGESPETVCPPHRWYTVPMAPPMAADVLGVEVPTIADLLDELTWPTPAVDVGWVETVGGPRSPIADDGDAVTLAQHLDPDVVVLVADAGLGTISAVLLSMAPFADRRCVIHLNRYDDNDPLHRANHSWLVERSRLEISVDTGTLAACLHRH